MKRFIILACFIALFSSNIALAEFPDVPEDYHLANSVNWLEDQGVVEGYPDGDFKPEQYVNRVEFLKMLYETIGYKDRDIELPFPDTPEGEWYIPYVKEAFVTGVVEGYPDGTFKPDNKINFAEAVKVVMNAFFDVEKLEIFTEGDLCVRDFADYYNLEDLDSSEWYFEIVSKADELCLFDFEINAFGFDEPVLHPGWEIDRADMAELLYRAKAIKDNPFLNQITPYNESMVPVEIFGNVKVDEDRFSFTLPFEWGESGYNGKWYGYSSPDYHETDADMAGYGTVHSGAKMLITVYENSDIVPTEIENADINVNVTIDGAQAIYSSYLLVDGTTRIEEEQILNDGNYYSIRYFYKDGETDFNLLFSNIMRTFQVK